MGRKKKNQTNGESHAEHEQGEILGREQRLVRRDLDDDALGNLRAKIRRTYEEERREFAAFKAFRKWAQPQIRAVLDPDYEPPEGTEELEGEVEARAMNDELEHRRKLKTARVAALKAERRVLLDCLANCYQYEVVELERQADYDTKQVHLVDPSTGLRVSSRAMTAAELQTLLPGTESADEAPDAVH